MKLQLHNETFTISTSKKWLQNIRSIRFFFLFICTCSTLVSLARYNRPLLLPPPFFRACCVSHFFFSKERKMKSLPPPQLNWCHYMQKIIVHRAHPFVSKVLNHWNRKYALVANQMAWTKRTKTNCNWNISMDRFIVSKIVDSVQSNVFPISNYISSQISLRMYQEFLFCSVLSNEMIDKWANGRCYRIEWNRIKYFALECKSLLLCSIRRILIFQTKLIVEIF